MLQVGSDIPASVAVADQGDAAAAQAAAAEAARQAAEQEAARQAALQEAARQPAELAAARQRQRVEAEMRAQLAAQNATLEQERQQQEEQQRQQQAEEERQRQAAAAQAAQQGATSGAGPFSSLLPGRGSAQGSSQLASDSAQAQVLERLRERLPDDAGSAGSRATNALAASLGQRLLPAQADGQGTAGRLRDALNASPKLSGQSSALTTSPSPGAADRQSASCFFGGCSPPPTSPGVSPDPGASPEPTSPRPSPSPCPSGVSLGNWCWNLGPLNLSSLGSLPSLGSGSSSSSGTSAASPAAAARSPSPRPSPAPTRPMSAVVASYSNLTVCNQALEAANLTQLLSPSFRGTLFCPSNQASAGAGAGEERGMLRGSDTQTHASCLAQGFAVFLAQINSTAAQLLGARDLVTYIMLYHIDPVEALRLANLTNGRSLPTGLRDQNLTVRVNSSSSPTELLPTGGDPARIVTPNILGSQKSPNPQAAQQAADQAAQRQAAAEEAARQAADQAAQQAATDQAAQQQAAADQAKQQAAAEQAAAATKQANHTQPDQPPQQTQQQLQQTDQQLPQGGSSGTAAFGRGAGTGTTTTTTGGAGGASSASSTQRPPDPAQAQALERVRGQLPGDASTRATQSLASALGMPAAATTQAAGGSADAQLAAVADAIHHSPSHSHSPSPSTTGTTGTAASSTVPRSPSPVLVRSPSPLPSSPSPPPTRPMADVVASYSNLTSCNASLAAANLTQLLGPSFRGTLFCPSNQAYANLTARVGANLTQLLQARDLITYIMLYHIDPVEALRLANLTNGRSLPTGLRDQNLTGIMHIISDVLLPVIPESVLAASAPGGGPSASQTVASSSGPGSGGQGTAGR
eukprot:scaffold5.g757.t1